MEPRKRVYLDHNASAPLLPGARTAMADVLALTGNPNSVHGEGRALRKRIEDARTAIARLAGAQTSRTVFTGSATEAITQAIVGAARAGAVDRIVTSTGEHKAVLKAAEAAGAPVDEVALSTDGVIDTVALGKVIADADAAGETVLVAVHWVNNETGVIQPLDEIEALLADTEHFLFVDAVQGFGKLPMKFAASRIDMAAVSAHKIAGPAGVGALFMKARCDKFVLIPGGGQEQGRRGGTESAALIAGFGKAAQELADAFDLERISALTGQVEQLIETHAPDAEIFGRRVRRLGTTISFAVPGLANATAMIGFDLGGVALSAGSACSSGKVSKSHVLKAMDVADELAQCALRVSLGWTTTEADIEFFEKVLVSVLAQRKSGRGAAA